MEAFCQNAFLLVHHGRSGCFIHLRRKPAFFFLQIVLLCKNVLAAKVGSVAVEGGISVRVSAEGAGIYCQAAQGGMNEHIIV